MKKVLQLDEYFIQKHSSFAVYHSASGFFSSLFDGWSFKLYVSFWLLKQWLILWSGSSNSSLEVSFKPTCLDSQIQPIMRAVENTHVKSIFWLKKKEKGRRREWSFVRTSVNLLSLVFSSGSGDSQLRVAPHRMIIHKNRENLRTQGALSHIGSIVLLSQDSSHATGFLPWLLTGGFLSLLFRKATFFFLRQYLSPLMVCFFSH